MNLKGGNVPIHLSATARSLSGLKVPSVSMYIALPSPPPCSMGSCGQMKTCRFYHPSNTTSVYQWTFLHHNLPHHCFLSRPYLTGDSECVAQLGLSRSKLSKHLRYGARLNPTCMETGSQPTQFHTADGQRNIRSHWNHFLFYNIWMIN